MKKNWEQTLRDNGYSNEDIIIIATDMCKMYEYGLKSRNFIGRLRYCFKLLLNY